MSAAVVSSEQETQRLQEEVDALRDQSHRELDTLHSQLHNTHTQLHTHTHAAQEHQREVHTLTHTLCETLKPPFHPYMIVEFRPLVAVAQLFT